MGTQTVMSLAELQDDEAIDKFFDDSLRAFEEDILNKQRSTVSNGYKTADEWLERIT